MSAIDPPSPFVPGLQPASTASRAPVPAPHDPGQPSRPRTRRTWLWAALLAGAVALAFFLAVLALGLGWVEPVRVFVDGEQVYGGPHLDAMSAGELFALSLAAMLALLVMLVVVPVAVVVAVVAVAMSLVLAVVVGLGLPLLIVALLVGLLLSPLILLGWLLIKLLS
jgi:hypothetical protein